MSEQEQVDVPEPSMGERPSLEQHAKFHWGASISEARQAELKALADKQREWVAQPEATRGDSVFEGVELIGADVSWLLEESGRDEYGSAPNLHLEGADLSYAHLESAHLDLAQLEGADLSGAKLKGADLRLAQLEGATLIAASLESAKLSLAHMEGADLTVAHMEEADLSGAQLKGANLIGAQLKGANLTLAQLEGADLRQATLDKTSRLNGTVLTGALLYQVTYDNVNLTDVDWSLVPVLGDELKARNAKDKEGKDKDKDRRRDEFAAAVRANRVLTATLRAQGMNEDADRYAYRAQVLQRQLLRRQRKPVRALFSAFLDLLAGHGYKPERTLVAYLLAILSFSTAYYFLGQVVGPHLSPLGAFVFSMTSFHGRGFFPGGIALDDPITVLAAFEAFVGLVIEVSFIATFTQRFFAR